MRNSRQSVVYEKAFDFAVKIINVYRNLVEQKREQVLSKQLLRAGTSIGANIREGLEGQSKKDFISKLSIALKEATETEYWIELLNETSYIDKKQAELLLKDIEEIIRMLNAIIKSSKQAI